MTSTRNEVKETHLAFQERRFQGFIFETLRVAGLLGEKFTFFKSIGTTKISRCLKLSAYINVVLLINLNYASTSNIREVIKFYNLGNKTFETDFNNMSHKKISSQKFPAESHCLRFNDLASLIT